MRMVDPDKIRKRAQAATEKAAESLQTSIEELNQYIEQMREKLKVSAVTARLKAIWVT